MTREEAVRDLTEAFGTLARIPVPGERGIELTVIDTPQPVRGTAQTTKVAFKLAERIDTRPLHFVEPHVRLRSGGRPNNASNQELGGQLWQTWSLNTNWSPTRHTVSQLAMTVLSVWDR
jgi:hypothetical protein